MLDIFVIPIATIALFLVLVYFIEYNFTQVLVPHKERISDLYQGGETIKTKVRRYRTEEFNLSLFYRILHVIGFMGATIFILSSLGKDVINYTTMGFGIILFYTIILVKASEGVEEF